MKLGLSPGADPFSLNLKRAIDFLFFSNPKGTSIGALTGVCVYGAVQFVSPLLTRYLDVIAPAKVSVHYFIVAGILLLNVTTRTRRRPLPPQIEDAFEVIRRSNLSVTQKRMQHLALINHVIQSVTVSVDEPTKARRRRESKL